MTSTTTKTSRRVLTPKMIGAIAAAAAASFAGTYTTIKAATASAKTEISAAPSDKLDRLMEKVDAIASDVRLLKCDREFPGDCPGQAHRR